jgi:hypothetical protein
MLFCPGEAKARVVATVDLHVAELEEDWALARAGRDLNEIEPLK